MFVVQDIFSVPIVHRKTFFLPLNPLGIYHSQLLSKRESLKEIKPFPRYCAIQEQPDSIFPLYGVYAGISSPFL
jgi:hypothetical protein